MGITKIKELEGSIDNEELRPCNKRQKFSNFPIYTSRTAT